MRIGGPPHPGLLRALTLLATLGAFFAAWLFSLTVSLSAFVMALVLLCLNAKWGVSIYPTWPRNERYRRLNAALFAHAKAVKTWTLSVAGAALGCLFLAVIGRFIDERIGVLSMFCVAYLATFLCAHSERLHYDGFALKRHRHAAGALEPHLIVTDKRKALSVLRRLKAPVVDAVLRDIRRLGYTKLYVYSPNGALIRFVRDKLDSRFGREALREATPRRLSRRQSLYYRCLFSGRDPDLRNKRGRLEQVGFVFEVPDVLDRTQKI